jgi:hypothetical protein
VERVKGFFIIVGALGPIIALVLIVVMTLVTVQSVTTSARTYSETVGVEIAEAKAVVDAVTAGFEQVGGFVTGVSGAVSGVAGDIAAAQTSLSVTMPSVVFPRTPLPLGITIDEITLLRSQDLTATVPGSAEVKKFFGDAATVSDNVTGELRRQLGAIFRVPDQITNIAEATGVFGSEVRSALYRWFLVTAAVLALALLGWIVGSMSRIVRDTRRGWSMLIGHSPPPSTIEDLGRRMQELQDEVAAYHRG